MGLQVWTQHSRAHSSISTKMSVTFANDSGVKQSSQTLEKAEEKVSLLAIPRQHILDAA